LVFAAVLSSVFYVATATFGVDVSSPVSESDWRCLKSNDFTFAAVRVYESTGRPDPNAVKTMANARSAGIGVVDAYMFPCPKCSKSAADQVEEAVKNLRDNKAQFSIFWFDIEGPQYWGSQSANKNFLTQALSKAESLGVKIGIYTSESQWIPIFGDWDGGAKYPLWYAHYDGRPNFSDFKPFAGWKKPVMKQYQGDVTKCGVGIDEDWY